MIFALPPLAAEPIFNIGSFTATNTYITSSLTVIIFVVLGYIVKRNLSDIPRGLQNIFELIMETLLGYFDQVTGSRQKSLKFFPLIGSLFFFILISNWMGILPGVGSIGFFRVAAGHKEFVPLFRSANADLNLTLAMAVSGVVISHVIGVMTIGFFKYFGKFIKVADVWHAIKSKKVMNIFVAFIEVMVGFLEIISEVAKMLSLSLRLFGNVFAGEVLLTVLAGLIAYVVPLPFLALEIIVGLIQAIVFSMLVLVYISIATMPVHGHHEEKEQHKEHPENPALPA